MSKKTTTGVKSSVKFRLPESVKNKAVGGELKLTCPASFTCTTSLEQFLNAVCEATGHYPMTFKDRHTNIETAWVSIESVEKTLVGRKEELLAKLEWLAS